MKQAFDDLPDWSFEIEEQSAGVYVATGKDKAGRSVVVTGVDPEHLLQQCKTDAIKLAMVARIQPTR
jgi:hypothetical protein